MDQGADAAVGWTTTVSAGSHTNWLKRYNNSLAGGKTVSQAINDANSYIYLPGSGVKNANTMAMAISQSLRQNHRRVINKVICHF